MQLSIFLPLLAWLLAVILSPQHPFFDSAAFPHSAWLAMGLAALLAALMRQWSWCYWLALLAGCYWAGLMIPQLAPGAAGTGAALLFLPLGASLIALLLSLLPRLLPLPPPWSPGGLVLLAGAAGLPALLLLLPLESYQRALDLPGALAGPAFTWSVLSLPALAGGSLLAAGWGLVLLLSAAPSSSWGQLACWLGILGMFALIGQPQVSGWAVIAASMSVLLALALQMLNLAYFDELTRLPQRRALMARLRRLGRRSAICMLDVDHFKKFNDVHGHEAGDQVLRLLGSILARERGFRAYRYGGEEFTLVFRHDKDEAITEALERLRARVAAYPFRLRSGQRPADRRQGRTSRGKAAGSKALKVTISLGCALRREGEHTQALLERADALLYKAKKAGRNRVVTQA